MARLSDVPAVLKVLTPLQLAKRVWHEIGDDGVFVWASALAYAWLFAIFPFFIFLLTLVPYVPVHVKAKLEGPVYDFVDHLPHEMATLLHANIDRVMHETHTGLLSVGILLTVWAASGGMNMTLSAMDKIYDVAKPRAFYKQRPIAVGLTVVVALCIVAVLILLPLGTAVTRYVEHHAIIPGLHRGVIIAWNCARYALALVLMFTILAAIYHFGPSVKQRFHPVTPGAVFTVASWLILDLLFRVYVDKFGKYDKTYGTVGGVAVLLLFFYIDAVVLLVGAEINSEIDFALGVPRGSADFRRKG